MEYHGIKMIGKYILQLLSSNPSTNEEGRMWFNTTDDKVVVGTGSDEKNLAYEEDLDDHIATGASTNPRAHGAASGPVPDSIMARNVEGRCSVEHPGDYEYHIATKGYVDGNVAAASNGYSMDNVHLFRSSSGLTGTLTIVNIDWTYGGTILGGSIYGYGGKNSSGATITIDGSSTVFSIYSSDAVWIATLPSGIKFTNTLKIECDVWESGYGYDEWPYQEKRAAGSVWVYQNQS